MQESAEPLERKPMSEACLIQPYLALSPSSVRTP